LQNLKGPIPQQFEESPVYSALSSATENNHYVELGVMAIFIRNRVSVKLSVKVPVQRLKSNEKL
jgi:hypothetical protein